MAENGNNLLILLDSSVIAGAKSAEIKTSCETIEIASASNSQWTKLIAGRKEWSVSVGYLVTLTNTGSDLLRVGTTYEIKVMTRSGSSPQLAHGNAILTDVNIRATRGSLMEGSFTFKGADVLNLG